MAWSRVYNIPFSSQKYKFHLHGLSDLQIGSRSTIIDKIRMRIESILDDPEDSGVVIPGDIEDEDRPSTRVIRKAAFAGREEVVERDAKKHMSYIKDKIIPVLLPLQKTKHGIMCILAGHHWTQLSSAINSAQFIAQELTRQSGRLVPYLGHMSAWMDLRFRPGGGNGNGTVRHIVHVQHGVGGGNARGSALRKLDLAAHGFHADSYIRGHDCQIEAAKIDQLYPKKSDELNPDIMARTIGFLNLGAATQGYEKTRGAPAYPEEKMMRPSAMDWGTLKLTVRRARKWEDPSENFKVDQRIEI